MTQVYYDTKGHASVLLFLAIIGRGYQYKHITHMMLESGSRVEFLALSTGFQH